MTTLTVPTAAPVTRAAVEVRAVWHAYGGWPALGPLDLEVRHGELLAVLGPSGCGKSTLLRILAGLLEPAGGEVLLDGQSPRVARHRRALGWLAQDDGLLPWRSVADNVALPLRLAGRHASPVQPLLEQDPDLLARFLRATLHAMQDADAQPDAATDVVMQYAPEEDRAHQLAMLKVELDMAHDGVGQRLGVGWASHEQWQALHDSLLAYGGLSAPTDVDAAFSDAILRRVYSAGGGVEWP